MSIEYNLLPTFYKLSMHKIRSSLKMFIYMMTTDFIRLWIITYEQHEILIWHPFSQGHELVWESGISPRKSHTWEHPLKPGRPVWPVCRERSLGFMNMEGRRGREKAAAAAAAGVPVAARGHRWSTGIYSLALYRSLPPLPYSTYAQDNNQSGVSLTCPSICGKEVLIVTWFKIIIKKNVIFPKAAPGHILLNWAFY